MIKDKIDLIRDSEDTVKIVDFKTKPKSDLEKYRRQLLLSQETRRVKSQQDADEDDGVPNLYTIKQRKYDYKFSSSSMNSQTPLQVNAVLPHSSVSLTFYSKAGYKKKIEFHGIIVSQVKNRLVH